MSSSIQNVKRPAVKVFVATTVMLTFISFWRAAAIVLSDLASSAYYAGGDAESTSGDLLPALAPALARADSDTELRRVVEAWPCLPERIRQAVLTLIGAGR